MPASRRSSVLRILGVYVAYRQRDSSYDFSLRLDREDHRKSDRERLSAVHAEIDFALVATDVPPINERGQISGLAKVTVSPCEHIFAASHRLLRYRIAPFFFI